MAAANYPSKNFTFTIQATEEQEVTWPLAEECPIEPPDSYRYMMCQIERAPTTGKLHLQGFICFERNKRAGAVARMPEFQHAHIEVMRGTVKQNEEYCSKEDSKVKGPWRFGDAPAQGKRTDWAEVKTMISQGKTRTEVYSEAPHLANCCRGIETLYEHFSPAVPLTRDVRVCVLTGATGTGKSHRARTSYPDAYVITGKYYEGKSFDQYRGEATLILDEWRNGEWPLTFMNAILDKWKLSLQCRYQNKWAAWTTVILCTNEDPDAAYSRDPCFHRRIEDRIIHVIDQQNPDVDLKTF